MRGKSTDFMIMLSKILEKMKDGSKCQYLMLYNANMKNCEKERKGAVLGKFQNKLVG